MGRFAWAAFVAGTIAFLSLPQAHAQTPALPQCRVGLHLERAGALNYPATIDKFDAAKGAWHVKYDNGDLPEWLTGQEIRRGCTAPAAPAITSSFFVGNWEMFVNAAIGYQIIGGQRYLTVGSGATAPPLTIKADGTYVWHIDSRTTINGRWRAMTPAEMKYGFKDKTGILLMKGYDGGDWQVTYSGVRSDDKRDQLNVERMDLGLNYLATRMH
ncbi:MAG: hypothetical protein WCI21_01095 [Alphaproteobacteria bacterium]